MAFTCITGVPYWSPQKSGCSIARLGRVKLDVSTSGPCVWHQAPRRCSLHAKTESNIYPSTSPCPVRKKRVLPSIQTIHDGMRTPRHTLKGSMASMSIGLRGRRNWNWNPPGFQLLQNAPALWARAPKTFRRRETSQPMLPW